MKMTIGSDAVVPRVEIGLDVRDSEPKLAAQSDDRKGFSLDLVVDPADLDLEEVGHILCRQQRELLADGF
jgi:hypothetical protein